MAEAPPYLPGGCRPCRGGVGVVATCWSWM